MSWAIRSLGVNFFNAESAQVASVCKKAGFIFWACELSKKKWKSTIKNKAFVGKYIFIKQSFQMKPEITDESNFKPINS